MHRKMRLFQPDFARFQTLKQFIRNAGINRSPCAKWQGKLEKIRKGLVHGKRQGDAAREELMAIRDPEAAVAIAIVLCSDGGPTALAGIDALKNLPGVESAMALAHCFSTYLSGEKCGIGKFCRKNSPI